MAIYGSAAGVASRLPGRTISATSDPTDTEVTAWLDQAESRLGRELVAIGLAIPVVGTDPVNIVKDVVESRAAYRWLSGAGALAASQEDVQLKADLKKEWDDFLLKIAAEPGKVATLLGQGAGSSGGPSQLRSYATDNTDGKSIDAGDFPVRMTLDEDL